MITAMREESLPHRPRQPEGLRRAAQVCPPHSARWDCNELSKVSCCSRDATAFSCHSRGRTCDGQPRCAPRPARHDHSEPSTSSCRSRDAAPACHSMRRACAVRPKCVPRPARRDHSELSTPFCRSRDAIAPACHCRGRARDGRPRCGPHSARQGPHRAEPVDPFGSDTGFSVCAELARLP